MKNVNYHFDDEPHPLLIFPPKARRIFFQEFGKFQRPTCSCKTAQFLTTAFTVSALEEIFEKWWGGINASSSAGGIAVLFGVQERAQESRFGARPAG